MVGTAKRPNVRAPTRQKESEMFKNVIVGVDGNQGGRDAIALARVLLADDGELTFGHVYHGDPHVWHGPSPPTRLPSATAPGGCSSRRGRTRAPKLICAGEDLPRQAAGFTSSPRRAARTCL
jgi:hypothetical protein